jgi:hypothetical protein
MFLCEVYAKNGKFSSEMEQTFILFLEGIKNEVKAFLFTKGD